MYENLWNNNTFTSFLLYSAACLLRMQKEVVIEQQNHRIQFFEAEFLVFKSKKKQRNSGRTFEIPLKSEFSSNGVLNKNILVK